MASPAFPPVPAVPEPPFYPFGPLLRAHAALRDFQTGDSPPSIDLSTRPATLALAQAILRVHFRLTLTLPPRHLIPTIPNRVQYLSWVLSLPRDDPHPAPCLLDIGTGPSAIYAMLAARLHPTLPIVATDVDPVAVSVAKLNVSDNLLSSRIHVIHTTPHSFFPSTVQSHVPTITLCNPPFHAHPGLSASAGTPSQVSTPGGELAFLRRLAQQSVPVSSIIWFTSLLGRKADVAPFLAYLRSTDINATRILSVRLDLAARTARWAVAWTFGPYLATVTVHPIASSRISLHICPGRRFANRLTVSDLFQLILLPLRSAFWSVSHHSSDEILAVAPHDSAYPGTTVAVVIVPHDVPGTFTTHVKLHRRGSLTNPQFVSLVQDIAHQVEQILNQHAPFAPTDTTSSTTSDTSC